MDLAGTAVGIVSLGIQLCQGLIDYYDAWKSYKDIVKHTVEYVINVNKSFELLKRTLEAPGLNEDRLQLVEHCLQACQTPVADLQQKLHELRKYDTPSGFRQKTFAELQRSWYPLHSKTLRRLQTMVIDLQGRLSVAVQILELDIAVSSDTKVTRIDETTTEVLDFVRKKKKRNVRRDLGRCIRWLGASDPLSNHQDARDRHEPHTGSWLLGSRDYQRWKNCDVPHLWLHGKAGCGKTVICSTVIDDIQSHCKQTPNAACVMFYFSFSDKEKQSFKDMVFSMVAQLADRVDQDHYHALSKEHAENGNRTPDLKRIEEVLSDLVHENFSSVFLVVDAIDECPEDDANREKLLEGIERLSKRIPVLKVMATSQPESDVKDSMDRMRALEVYIDDVSVNGDIETYLNNQMLNDRTLSKLGDSTKAEILDTFRERSDGMFRWAYCQLEELKKLKSFAPKFVSRVLNNLPSTLNDTYERMVAGISEIYYAEAIAALQWLAFARRPLSLSEMVEICIIDPAGEGFVDEVNRGRLEDLLNILAGLVTVDGVVGYGALDDRVYDYDLTNNQVAQEQTTPVASLPASHWRFNSAMKIRLAHSSVKDYLLSDRVSQKRGLNFKLESGAAYAFITAGCLTYLRWYSERKADDTIEQHLVQWPLLKYAAVSWYYHSYRKESDDITKEIQLLSSHKFLLDWQWVFKPQREYKELPTHPGDEIISKTAWWHYFDELPSRFTHLFFASGFYYACLFKLEAVVKALCGSVTNKDAVGGYYGSAIQAAASRGYLEIVKMLIDAGASVEVDYRERPASGHYTPLAGASAHGHKAIVKLLLDSGATIKPPYFDDSALINASKKKHLEVVQILLERGADANDGALHYAVRNGDMNMTQLLLDHGADPNAIRSLPREPALITAISGGRDPTRGRPSVVHVGSRNNMVKLLICNGGDVSVPNPNGFDALQEAIFGADIDVVRTVLDSGAEPRASDITIACSGFHTEVEIVKILLNRGIKPSAMHLIRSCLLGDLDTAQFFLDTGLNVNSVISKEEAIEAGTGSLRTALQHVQKIGYKKVEAWLVANGAINSVEPEETRVFQSGSMHENDDSLDSRLFSWSRPLSGYTLWQEPGSDQSLPIRQQEHGDTSYRKYSGLQELQAHAGQHLPPINQTVDGNQFLVGQNPTCVEQYI